jgi:peptidoglycan/xylan/chitin deacetylase (PgdA/CDA1 family)
LSPVSLTFDDGPDPEWTPQVLDALGRTGVAATFFVVAEQIAEPGGTAVLAAARDAGHSIQPHCRRRVLDTLAENGVREPRFWRPPYGAVHPEHSAPVAEEVGLKLELWTHDPRDYSGAGAREMLTGLGSLDADAVILLHDSRRYAHATDSAANTVELIEPLVALIRARGYEIAPLA